MRARHVRMFEHHDLTPLRRLDRRQIGRAGEPLYQRHSHTTRDYRAGFATVQEHLHAGNSYEVNLTYREEQGSDLDPATAYLRLRELNPAPYAGFLQHDLPGARAWLLSSSPERYALIDADRMIETKPIKGTTPRGATAEEDARPARPAGRRAEVPRREPDDHRPPPQRPVDGVRARERRGAEPDGGGVLRDRAPAGVHDPRPAPRRRDDRRGAAGAVPGGLDDGGAEAAHHADHRAGREQRRADRTPGRSAGSRPTARPTWGW